jgi:hypothetical protein
VPCEPDNISGHPGCMSESCQLCYEMGGTNCTSSGGNCWTPILIDVTGNGFDLTDASNGVYFDEGTGTMIQTAWTSAGSDDAWLVLDRNGNGEIDDARELFGSAASQPPPLPGDIKNGFRALAEFDKPGSGGNANGFIDNGDVVFPSLRLWEDLNHNGVSEPAELRSLFDLEIDTISLDYRESRRRDRWGNTFRYRAKIYGTTTRNIGRWAHDVFLLSHPVNQTQRGILIAQLLGISSPAGSLRR